MWQQDGFVKEAIGVSDAIGRLDSYIESLPGQISKFSSEEMLRKPAVDKWSKQEILGHLIDSAINNLKRFTEIQFLPQPYIVTSYQQVNLVAVNDYQNLPLDHMLNLWQALNKQIVFVIKNLPEEKLNCPVAPHYENKEMKTFGWMICDYLAHLEHHFRQIFLSS
ncbi:MAG TPA: DinB family protein [Chitinophagaceae bacterium]|nr:DinB family protein [Chitinophagaceae bacterium]